MPLERVCNYVYYMLTKDADKTALARFNAKLWMPPAGVEIDSRSPWSAENENKALAGLASQLGMSKSAPSGASNSAP